MLVKGVPQLGYNLVVLGRLTEEINILRRQIRSGRQAVDYLMGDASGFRFGSVMWGKRRLALESGEFYPLYQGS